MLAEGCYAGEGANLRHQFDACLPHGYLFETVVLTVYPSRQAGIWNPESTVLSRVLEEGIEALPCVIALAGIGAAGHEDRIRLEIIAVVGGFFVTNPFCLNFSALVVLSGIVEPAVAAAVHVGVAARTRIAGSNAFRCLNNFAALEAGKAHKPGKKGQPPEECSLREAISLAAGPLAGLLSRPSFVFVHQLGCNPG